MKRLALLAAVLLLAGFGGTTVWGPLVVADASSIKPYKQKGGKLEATVLIDGENAGPGAPSMTVLGLARKTSLPLHRQSSSKAVVVLDGCVRVKGLAGGPGQDAVPGDVIIVPASVAYGLEATCCKNKKSHVLVVYLPGGPERPYKHPLADKEGLTTPVPAADLKKPDPAAPQPQLIKVEGIAYVDGVGRMAPSTSVSPGVDRVLVGARGLIDWTSPSDQVIYVVKGELGVQLHGNPASPMAMKTGDGAYVKAGTHLDLSTAGTAELVRVFAP